MVTYAGRSRERGMDYVTHARPHVDRCATAWLLQRFVDKDARFHFVEPGAALPTHAAPFDLPGAKMGHRGDKCTFESVVEDHGLDRDPALVAVARLVRDVDMHVMEMPESAGLDAILAGLKLAERD